VRVTIDDPPTMNVLGLFLASRLRRRGGAGAGRTRGTLVVDADGMRAGVRFEEAGVTITRQGLDDARASAAGSLAQLVAALARPGLRTLWRVKVRGNRLFAFRAFRNLGTEPGSKRRYLTNGPDPTEQPGR